MNIYNEGSDLVLTDLCDFDLEDILECGQCFHFSRLGVKDYELLAMGRFLHVFQRVTKENGIEVVFQNTTRQEYEAVWSKYFDMDTDYKEIKRTIIQGDERLEAAVNSKAGIRILRQDFFETLISFIISQNKQIPHIKQIVHTISERFGDEIVLPDGRSVYAFPTLNQMKMVTEEELRECKTGFRAPYIKDAVAKILDGAVDGEKLRRMSPDEARQGLMQIKGVGEKVANCTMLFGLGIINAFPVDVWMKRIMEHMYFGGRDTDKAVIESFAYKQFGEYAGYAQQYLFCYGRENEIGKN